MNLLGISLFSFTISCFREKLKEAKALEREGMPRARSSYPRPGIPNQMPGLHTAGEPPSEFVVSVTSLGLSLPKIYLIDSSRKRTVVPDYTDICKVPQMQAVMDLELSTFHNFDSVTEVPLSTLSHDDNLVSTRSVLTIKTNDDGARECSPCR